MSEYSMHITNFERQKSAVLDMLLRGLQSGAVMLKFARPTRSNEQNAKLWAMLSDISKQVTHHGLKYSATDWKNILTAAFEGESRMAPNLDGNGLVFLGAQTRKYSVKQMHSLIEFIYSAGSERGVEWSEQSVTFDENGQRVAA